MTQDRIRRLRRRWAHQGVRRVARKPPPARLCPAPPAPCEATRHSLADALPSRRDYSTAARLGLSIRGGVPPAAGAWRQFIQTAGFAVNISVAEVSGMSSSALGPSN